MSDAQSPALHLPLPPELERRCVALATLDAILMPEWEYRYYSFNRRWSPASGTRMASMRNGSGDNYFILFFPDGSAALKGFDHESAALKDASSIPGVLDGLPERFGEFANEPAFSFDSTTFCLWSEGQSWDRSRSLRPATIAEDGSLQLLAMLVGSAFDYVTFAREYFEIEVDERVVARFFACEPLTAKLLSALRPDATLDDLASDLEEIGYPVGV